MTSNSRDILCVVAGALVALSALDVRAQTPSFARIAAHLTDRQGIAIGGAQMTVTGAGLSRSAVTDRDGNVVFDDLPVDTLYTVTTYPIPQGFYPAARRDIAVRAGETVAVDFSVGLYCGSIIDSVIYSPLDQVLLSDAVVHIRIPENARQRLIERNPFCEVIDEVSTLVLGAAHIRPAEWRASQTIPIYASDKRLDAGDEYLAMMSYSRTLDRFVVEKAYFFEVVSGRLVEWFDDDLFGIHNGDEIGQAVTRLRAVIGQHSRYRNYDDIRTTVPVGTLRYKTGWISIGVLMDHDVWEDGQPFEFVRDPGGFRAVPRPGDQIRILEGRPMHPVVIVDYGSRGEALRFRSPTSGVDGGIKSVTGTHFEPNTNYIVSDVQFQVLSGYGSAGFRVVWLRLTAP